MTSQRLSLKNVILFLLLLSHSVKLVKCFVILPHHQTRRPVSRRPVPNLTAGIGNKNIISSSKSQWKTMSLLMVGDDDRQVDYDDDDNNNNTNDGYSKVISIFGSLSALAWILV